YLPCKLAATDRVKTAGGPRLDQRAGQLLHEVIIAAVDHMRRPDPLEKGDLRLAAHDVDKRDAVLGTNLDEHLTKVRCGRGVDKGAMSFHPHRFGKGETGERVDESGCAIAR